MSAFLHIPHADEPTTIECRGITTLGRDKENDVVLADRLVSRNHAIVRRLGRDDYYLIDSGSANGSFVNGRRVSTPTLLKHGDRIAIGSVTLRFECIARPRFSRSMSSDDESTLISSNIRIQQIAMLVADLRGFTVLSESVPIATLSKLMSEWFHNVSASIQASDGVVEKFIGDCVYARWDIADDNAAPVVHTALKAALELHRITDSLNTRYPDLPVALRIGAGINIGHAAVGVRHDDAAVGDAVNTTFRLESASKELGCDVVLGHDAYRLLPPSQWNQREKTIAVKGKREPLSVCGYTFAELGTSLS